MTNQTTIVVFGIIRAPEITLPSLRNVLNTWTNAAGANIIFSLFDLTKYENPRTGEVISTNNEVMYEYDAAIKILITEEQFNREFTYTSIKKMGNYWGDDWKTMDNIMRQLYSLKLASARIKDTAQRALFIRGDLLYETDLIDIYYQCSSLDIGFVSPSWQRWENGFNDRFYYVAGQELISAVGERLDNLSEFCAEVRKPFHPESFLKYCVSKQTKNISYTNERAFRVRANGKIVQENFDPNWKFRLKKNPITETLYRRAKAWISSA